MVVAGNQLGGQDRAKAACRVKLSAAKQACLPPTQRGPDELVPAAASLNEQRRQQNWAQQNWALQKAN